MSERLQAILAEIGALDARRRELIAERGRIVREMLDERGWKRTARVVGVGKTRLYAMVYQGRQNAG